MKKERLVVGIDEVGIGCIAGPVVTAAVVMLESQTIKGVRDSKKVSENRRMDLVHDIDRECLFWVIAQSSSKMIDKYGIRLCNRVCMKWCAKVARCKYPNAMVIVDGVDPILGVPFNRQRVIIKADDKFVSVGAASIMAKVHRDKYMIHLSTIWPNYSFHRHKGYGTEDHLIQLDKYGPCPEHRRSFGPVEKVLRKGAKYAEDGNHADESSKGRAREIARKRQRLARAFG
jgi:ribonuclease HII